ncbi:MAG: Plug domain-containing protein, partial [Cyclobacteriaceae bacterium]
MILKTPEIFVFALCILLSVQATAQVNIDSARLLKTVVVNQSRLNDYVIGSYELPIDSSALALASNGSLTDLLRKQGFGHIRSYGPGGVASPSFRGTGSGHTAVLWNGIDLTSPLTGQLDLSLLPAGLFDDVSIQTGGSTSISGNGSIGANIHLNNNLNFNEGLRASVSSHIGSFGYH